MTSRTQWSVFQWIRRIAGAVFLAFCVSQVVSAAERPAGSRDTTLSWEAIEDATLYEVDVRHPAANASKPVNVGGGRVPTTSFQIWLVPGSYELRLRALDRRSVPGAWGEWTPFVVKPFPVRLVAPKSGQRFATDEYEQYKVTFKWEPSQGAVKYHLQVFDAANKQVADKTLNDTETTLTIPVGVAYSWRVTAIAGDGLEGDLEAKARSFVVIGGALEMPVIRTKSTGDTITGAIWNAPTNVTSFDIKVLVRPAKALRWKVLHTAQNTTDRDLTIQSTWPAGRLRIGVRALGDWRKPSPWTWEEIDFRQGSAQASTSSLPENPGISESEISAGGYLGVESIATTGGLSEFGASSPVTGFTASLITRTDPGQGERWVIGASALTHTFRAEITETYAGTETQDFRRFYGDAWLGYELLNPAGAPTSAIVGIGFAVGRIPGLTVEDIESSQGAMEDKTWIAMIARGAFAWRPTFTNALGLDLAGNVRALTDGKARRYEFAAWWRPQFVVSWLPAGWFLELRADMQRETRSLPFACGTQPGCQDESSSTANSTTSGISLGSRF
jgi:hypothetical protein